MDMDEIDVLLERYLHLLHEYTTLRAELSSLQSGIYQDIARANFAAERGMRYGRDFYDDRMQATRRLEAAVNAEGSINFQVVNTQQTGAAATEPEPDASVPREGGDQVSEEDDKQPAEAGTKDVKKPKRKDPLQWFGLLTPQPLRQAQAQSIKAVEGAIPRLVTINAEMLQVEIQVRRARKRRAKAEAAAARTVEDGIAGEKLTA